MSSYYEYLGYYPVTMTPEEEFMEWVTEHDPEPSEEELQRQYEELKEGGFLDGN